LNNIISENPVNHNATTDWSGAIKPSVVDKPENKIDNHKLVKKQPHFNSDSKQIPDTERDSQVAQSLIENLSKAPDNLKSTSQNLNQNKLAKVEQALKLAQSIKSIPADQSSKQKLNQLFDEIFNTDPTLKPKSATEYSVSDLNKEFAALKENLLNADNDSNSESTADNSAKDQTNSTKTNKITELFDKGLKAATYINGAASVTSIAANIAALKAPGISKAAEKIEKASLGITKLQIGAIGSNFFKKGLDKKDGILMIVGLAQSVKLLGGFDRLLRLAGVPSAFDQIPEALGEKIGKSEFNSIGESFKLYGKAAKEVMGEIMADKMGHLKLNPQTGKHTKLLLPLAGFMMTGALMSNVCDSKYTGPLRQPLTLLFTAMRHITGAHSDIVLAKDDHNPNNKKAGIIYALGSLADCTGVATPLLKHLKGFKDLGGDKLTKIAHIMHQTGAGLNPFGEMMLNMGMSYKKHTEQPA
jgi:hypothetical protein